MTGLAEPICKPHSQVDSWYALRVRCHAEKSVDRALTCKGYESYLPLYRKKSRWSDRHITLDAVLFPGYVFCRVDLNHRWPVLNTPGVVDIVRCGIECAAISDYEIEMVRAVVRSGIAAVQWPFLGQGDRVRINHGPLEGLEGLIVREKNMYRVVISIGLLQSSVAVEIDRDWIEPAPAVLLRRTA